MGVLLLGPDDHRSLLSFEDGIELMRKGFEEFANSHVTLSNPRTRTTIPNGFRMTVHQGITPSLRGACVHARSERLEHGERQKLARRGRPVFTVFDTETSELLMIMIGEPRPRGFEEQDAAAGFHTACAAAVGTDLVARQDAARVGVLGSRGQAVLHLAAVASVRPITEAVVYSPTRANREAFAHNMQKQLGVPVKAVDTTKQVLEFAEILLVCTNANEPVLDGSGLRPGTHLTSIVHSNKGLVSAGLVKKMRREIDDETLRRAQLIVTTNKTQEELDEPEVLYGAAQRGVISWENIVDMRDLITGRISTREVHEEQGITFFKNAGGWGIGAGAFFRGIYDQARKAGAGIELENIDGLEPAY